MAVGSRIVTGLSGMTSTIASDMVRGPRVLESERLHVGGPVGLRVDRVELPGMRDPVERTVVEYQPASVLVPLDDKDGSVLLTRQHRYPVARDLWELPGGIIEPGESAEDCAVRELAEETGHRVLGPVRRLLAFFPEPAFADHQIDVFAATVSRTPDEGFAADADVERTQWITIAQALRWIAAGEISSSWSVIGLLSLACCRREEL
jgi:ADP-ribose pyrophosphatase